MALQTQDLDVRRDIGLLKAGKASHGYDMVGLGIPIGHANTALSATVTVAEEGYRPMPPTLVFLIILLSARNVLERDLRQQLRLFLNCHLV